MLATIRRICPIHNLLIAISISFLSVLLLSGCGGGGSSSGNNPPASQADNTGGGNNGAADVPAEIADLLNTMAIMASVTDADGNPIQGAIIGEPSGDEDNRTADDGIYMGDAQPNGSGWYRISAPGYATAYVNPLGNANDLDSFAVRLTPVGTLQSWSPGGVEPVVVTLGDSQQPDLTAEFSATAFSKDVTLSLTLLDPAKIGTTLAPLDSAETLYITHPFEIVAEGDSGQPLQPQVGEKVAVTLTDHGDMGDTPHLFWFDPDLASWKEESTAGCTRLDSAHVKCWISHFSQHAGTSDSPPPPSSSDDPQSAKRKSDEAFRKWEESGDYDQVPQYVLDAFAAEARAVISWALKNPSEEAKVMLDQTAARMQYVGILDIADLIDAIHEVIAKLAEPHLQNPQCENLAKIAHLLAQAMYYGAPVEADLLDVFIDLLNRCNVVQGWIEYVITLPEEIDTDINYFSGPRYWNEYHDIKLVIHAEDIPTSTGNSVTELVFEGTDKVRLDFAQVEYRMPEEGCSVDKYGYQQIIKAEPGNSAMSMTVSGSYVAPHQYTPEESSVDSSVLISTSTVVRDIYVDENGCSVDNEFNISPPGVIYKGNIAGQTPPVSQDRAVIATQTLLLFPSMWEIISKEPDSTSRSSGDSYTLETYSGSQVLEDIVSPLFVQNAKVVMRWHLEHIDYTDGAWMSGLK